MNINNITDFILDLTGQNEIIYNKYHIDDYIFHVQSKRINAEKAYQTLLENQDVITEIIKEYPEVHERLLERKLHITFAYDKTPNQETVNGQYKPYLIGTTKNAKMLIDLNKIPVLHHEIGHFYDNTNELYTLHSETDVFQTVARPYQTEVEKSNLNERDKKYLNDEREIFARYFEVYRGIKPYVTELGEEIAKQTFDENTYEYYKTILPHLDPLAKDLEEITKLEQEKETSL